MRLSVVVALITAALSWYKIDLLSPNPVEHGYAPVIFGISIIVLLVALVVRVPSLGSRSNGYSGRSSDSESSWSIGGGDGDGGD